jgi:hypothetical protein
MSGRFEGAITTPDEDEPPFDSSIPPAPERPPRPVLIELGSAILIVGSITALLGLGAQQLFAPNLPADAGLGILLVAVIDLATFAVGLLIRAGRWWRVCINVVAIAMFLYLTRFPNPIAVFYLFLDTIVFFGLMRHRAWFDWDPVEAAHPA